MAALVRHFGDEQDGGRACGHCDICDPAGAVLRQFRRATAAEQRFALHIADDLRAVEYKAAGTLQRSIDASGRLSRGEFDALLDSMTRAGWLAIEDAEYEKDGEVRRYRKISLTERGLDVREDNCAQLLLADGITTQSPAGGASVRAPVTKKRGVKESDEPPAATPQGEALAARLQTWRAEEAKRLRVPAFVVMHDRTLRAVAYARPRTPNQLMAVNGMGPAKVERFGEALLKLCCES